MKKTILGIAFVMAMVTVAGSAFAATTSNVTLRIIITGTVVSIVNAGVPNLYMDTIVAGTSTISAYAQNFLNDGSAMSDWSVQASDFTSTEDPAVWDLLGGAPGDPTGINQARISGIWGNNAVYPLLTNFLGDDVIGNTSVESTASIFAITTDSIFLKGYNIMGGANRNIWFRIDAPAASSGGLNRTFDSIVTISAAASL